MQEPFFAKSPGGFKSSNIKEITLSNREKEVIRLIAEEYSTAEIAEILFISEHTVTSHRKNIMIKLNSKNTAGMIRRSFEVGILKVPERISNQRYSKKTYQN